MEIKDKGKALKSMPYFQEWLKELGQPVENLDTLLLEGETVELSHEEAGCPGCQWKHRGITGFMYVGMTFHLGEPIKRRVPNGTVKYIPEEEKQ